MSKLTKLNRLDSYVPRCLSKLLFEKGYRTYPKHPEWKTFRISTEEGIKEIWIGGFTPQKDYMPCPSWRMLFNDIMRELWDRIK